MPQAAFADGFTQFCIDPSLNYYEGRCTIIVEGQYIVNSALANPIVPDTLIEIDSRLLVDQMFTAGSVLAESLKIIFDECDSSLIIKALPRADAGSAVAAAYTMTVTGPATSDGVIEIFYGLKKWSIAVPVTSGQTATVVGAAIAAAIPADFPYTATAATGVVTFTAKNGGTIGNYFAPVLNWRGKANYWPGGIAIATVRTVTGATDPAALNYANVMGSCCFAGFALLSGIAAQQTALRNFIRTQWDCSKPLCFGHGFTFNSGNVGQVLATGDGITPELSRLAYSGNDSNFPWALVANYAAKRVCSACTNPELSIQGPDNGLLSAVDRPENCSTPWSAADEAALRAGGFVVYGPVQGGQGQTTNPFIYNDVTNYLFDAQGRSNTTWRDTNSRYLDWQIAVSVAEFLSKYDGLALYTKSTKVPAGVKGTNLSMIRADFVTWVRGQIGTLFSEFDSYDKDITFKLDFDIARPCFGTPGLIWLFMTYRRPIRIVGFKARTKPKMLDNCVR